MNRSVRMPVVDQPLLRVADIDPMRTPCSSHQQTQASRFPPLYVVVRATDFGLQKCWTRNSSRNLVSG